MEVKAVKMWDAFPYLLPMIWGTVLACALRKYGAIKDTSTKPMPAAITYQLADSPYIYTLVAIPVVLAPPVLAANRVPARTIGPRDLLAIRKSSLLCLPALAALILETARPSTMVAIM